MNTANLQIEGLLLAVAAVNNALVQKGFLTAEELDALLAAAAEQVADRATAVSPSHAEAICFPLRFLRLANSTATAGGVRPFSELARLVGTTEGMSFPNGPSQPTEGGNPSFFPDTVPKPLRPDITQGAILRGPTEDRHQETLHAQLPGGEVNDRGGRDASTEADDQASVAVTPAEAIAAFGLKS